MVHTSLEQSQATKDIGIDLGLKDVATCSNGMKLKNNQNYRTLEKKLGKAQRARKKDRVRAIHAKIKNKIKNKRRDDVHKFSTKIVKENALIVVGNVNSSSLANTKMAKSVLDAGWFMLKTQLDYKSKAMQAEFVEVNEKYTTQICSCCGSISATYPREEEK